MVSNFDVQIKCKASGQVIKLPYDVSDYVKKDSLLVELDPVDEKRSVEQAKVSLSSALASLNQAKQNLVITKRKILISRQKAKNNIKAAEANYHESKS